MLFQVTRPRVLSFYYVKRMWSFKAYVSY
uniref:Uncharacterized protein n=1 Tax=Anguilla anguilla TaxID=7936 RepID=A0A0E9TEB8_ANGAN